MLLQTQGQLIALLYVAVGILLFFAVVATVIAALKSFQVKQFQDLLFKAERKIDNLERRMFNVLNAVPVALVETDTTGKFTFANKAAHQLLGRKDSELIGLRFHAATWGIAYPDGRQIPADLMPIARTLRGQTVKGFQHMLTQYGSTDKVMVSVTSMPIMNGMGEVIGATAAMVEIENETGEGIDDMTGLWRGHWFAAATVPFWGLDGEGKILDINNAALDVFDLKREQAVGHNWAQIFVQDEDYQAALDYLGDSRDDSDPHTQASLRLKLKAADGQIKSSLVTAWAVRTHEGGEAGLTVMALAAEFGEAPVAAAAVAPPAQPSVPPHAPLGDDDQQELEDFRAAEYALAAVGVGTWQYDTEADAIIEDSGMQALIGRETPGGPTLISDADQALADAEFQKIMSGAIDRMALDIRIAGRDGREHWITLKGQAERDEDGERRIFGVAFDCTEWKTADQPVTVVETAPATAPDVDVEAIRAEAREQALAEAKTDHEAALADARSAHDAALAEAQAKHEDELAALRDTAPTPEQLYDVAAQAPTATPEPVIIREPDPAVAEENERLKTRLEGLESHLDVANATVQTLQDRIDAMAATPPAEPDYSEHEARIEALQVELADAQSAHREAQARLDETLSAPPPEPDFSAHEARIDDLQTRLDQAEAARDETQTKLDDLAATPAPEPDYSEHEARIAAAQADLDTARDERNGWKARYEALAAAPPPDTSELENKLAATQFDLVKWQAAHRDLQTRLDQIAAQPVIDHKALEARIGDLQTALDRANTQHAEMEARMDQLHASLGHAQRFETVGRLTGDVAQDFAQMLSVINNALEVMSRQADTPESVRRLSEAALAAGKRGERLTRQLQAFQSEEF